MENNNSNSSMGPISGNTVKCTCSNLKSICTCVPSGYAPSTWTYPLFDSNVSPIRQEFIMTFTNKKGEVIGKLFEDAEGELCFEGKVKKSAKKFFKQVLKKHNNE